MCTKVTLCCPTQLCWIEQTRYWNATMPGLNAHPRLFRITIFGQYCGKCELHCRLFAEAASLQDKISAKGAESDGLREQVCYNACIGLMYVCSMNNSMLPRVQLQKTQEDYKVQNCAAEEQARDLCEHVLFQLCVLLVVAVVFANLCLHAQLRVANSEQQNCSDEILRLREQVRLLFLDSCFKSWFHHTQYVVHNAASEIRR